MRAIVKIALTYLEKFTQWWKELFVLNDDVFEFAVVIFNEQKLLQINKSMWSKCNLIAKNDKNSINLLRTIHSVVETIVCVN